MTEVAVESGSEERGEARGGLNDPLTALVLTLPIFLFYHLGVVFLPVRNAADVVTAELRALSDHSMPLYAGVTLAIGAAFAGALLLMGRGHTMRPRRFLFVFVEGVVFAMAMRAAGAYVVGSLRLAPESAEPGVFLGLVMSAGAGFYEELVFRVALFGGGWFALRRLMADSLERWLAIAGWALFVAVVFSGWHYVGVLSDPLELSSFVFRIVCGLVLTAIYVWRGFAAAVWTHTLYDIWVMVL